MRFADRELILRQYGRSADTSLTNSLARSLLFAQEAFRRLPPKTVLFGIDDPLTVVYSDASWQPGSPPKLGWVVFCSGSRPRAGACTVPDEIAHYFKERKSQIYIGEMLAALSALTTCGATLRNHRVLLFVDNQGALSTLVGGSAQDEDVAAVALLFQLGVVELGIRLWLEYVESDSNIADGPSRLLHGWAATSECKSVGAIMEHAQLPAIDQVLATPSSVFQRFDVLRKLPRRF